MSEFNKTPKPASLLHLGPSLTVGVELLERPLNIINTTPHFIAPLFYIACLQDSSKKGTWATRCRSGLQSSLLLLAHLFIRSMRLRLIGTRFVVPVIAFPRQP